MFVTGTTVPVYANDNISMLNKASAIETDGSENFSQDFAGLLSMQTEEDLDVKVVSLNETTAHLAWSSATMYLRYNVLKYNPITQIYEEYAVTNKPSIKLSKLAPDTAYNFIVTVYGNKKVNGFVSFVTKARVPKLNIEEVASDKVKLSVSNTEKGATVEIYRGKSKKNLKKIAVLKNKSSYTDKSVKSKKEYYYKVKTVTKNQSKNSTAQSKVVSAKTPVKMGLPAVSGKTKTYAYYKAVTVKSSPQYKLLNSKKCYTDKKTGIRMVDDCYCIALGSYYGSKIGTKYRITLSSGKSFNAILCDQKANRHTDSNNQYAMRNKDIVEFYVEKGKIPKGVRGDYGRLKQFEGSIVSIEKYV